MKKLFVATTAILFMLSLQSCLEDSCTNISTYYVYEPVYMTEAELRQEIQFSEPRDLCNPGKIYFYQDKIFISEKYEGVHIYDNSVPSSPVSLGFLPIPGNQDISIKNDILYADALIDILAIDISTLTNVQLVSRTLDIIDVNQHPENGYIVYYKQTEVRDEYDCRGNNLWLEDGNIAFNDVEFDGVNVLPNGSTGGGVAPSNTGIGGSTARMRIVGDHAYIVDRSNLKALDISNDGHPELVSDQFLDWDIETIYPYQDKLFIGSESGMYIFDNSNPAFPEWLSTFEHWRACDPVVVEDNTAYVTLRDGSECRGFINQLDVIDITDVLNPTLIESVTMTNPHGLAIRNNTLYICDGADGLKIFDATDDTAIDENLIHHEDDIQVVDVISLNENLLFAIGEGGFYQYDVTDKNNPELLSSISVVK